VSGGGVSSSDGVAGALVVGSLVVGPPGEEVVVGVPVVVGDPVAGGDVVDGAGSEVGAGSVWVGRLVGTGSGGALPGGSGRTKR
jgi:hypothetical protein